ncbi:MAG: hypothetical protein RLZZ165_2040 [Bacteroidota bacterium]|jgi:kynurenine formamidase
MADFKMTIEVGGRRYALRQPGFSIAIPMHFDGLQPNTYGVAPAHAEAYRSGGWVGDTRQGGSFNFETYTLTPHCNGTHTECIGHIVDDRLRIHEELQETLLPATLITVRPKSGHETRDHYHPPLATEDIVIDLTALHDALLASDAELPTALVIRTLPNDRSKSSRDYMRQTPAFLTLEAMAYLVGLGVQHLLVDIPSVDRLFDGGILVPTMFSGICLAEAVGWNCLHTEGKRSQK